MEFTFKIGQKIKEAWPLYKNNLVNFFLLLIVVLLIEVINYKNNFILGLISLIVFVFIMYMAIRFLLSIVDKKEFSFFSKSSLPSLHQLWNFLKTYILFSIILMVCILVFVVPAFLLAPFAIITKVISIPLIISMILCSIVEIYFSTRLTFACFISVDKNQGARKSIKESWDMTRGHFWSIFGKMFLIGLFIFVGFLVLFVGSLITYPMGMILMVMLYRYFQKMKEGDIIPLNNKTEVIKEDEVLKVE